VIGESRGRDRSLTPRAPGDFASKQSQPSAGSFRQSAHKATTLSDLRLALRGLRRSPRRKKERGIRLALGAQPQLVVRLVMREVLLLLVIGLKN
jgi:hypothetical protein